MKLIVAFSKFFVGFLFIISGLIKLNDPIGFSFKLEEYFAESVLNLPFLIPFALTIAVLVVIFEVILGVMLLIGFKPKFTVWSLLLMIVFFTFLTFYSAYFNKVTDCGCFGDALKLTPWESFIKDIVLLFFILILFFNQKLIKPLCNPKTQNIVTLVAILACGYFGYHVLNHLPVKDFRAYKVGTDIQKGMEIPEGAPLSKYEMVFIYKINGVDTEFSQEDVMANKVPENAEFVDRKDKLIEQGYVPPIHDFTMELAGSDYKEELLVEPKLVIFVSYDLAKANEKGMKELEAFHQKAVAKGYKVIGMTASTDDLIESTKQKYHLTFDYYFCDPTTLKTIERANPSIVIMKKGIIVDKRHYNDIDKTVL
jgi:uncharacterized membrane protein YphA (DoxX/SURF4 family)